MDSLKFDSSEDLEEQIQKLKRTSKELEDKEKMYNVDYNSYYPTSKNKSNKRNVLKKIVEFIALLASVCTILGFLHSCADEKPDYPNQQNQSFNYQTTNK